jgi:hypothetical protein
MNEEVRKLAQDVVNEFFDGAPEKMVEQGVRQEYFDMCPHCKQEIHEKHEYTEDGGVTWRHSDCKGLINRPETPLDEISKWIRPYVERSQNERHVKRVAKGLNENLPIGGEEKYSKQEPGGEMMASNVSEDTEKECSFCHKPMGTVPEDPTIKGQKSHGICPECQAKLRSKKSFPRSFSTPGLKESTEERVETKVLDPNNNANFFKHACIVLNKSPNPVKATCTEFAVSLNGLTRQAYYVKLEEP